MEEILHDISNTSSVYSGDSGQSSKKHYVSDSRSLSMESDFSTFLPLKKEAQKMISCKHVSALYGIQFLSKVPLYRRPHSTSQEELEKKFQSFEKNQIFKLVHKFLHQLIKNSQKSKELFQLLQFMNEEMNLFLVDSRKDLGKSETESQPGSEISEEQEEQFLKEMKKWQRNVSIKCESRTTFLDSPPQLKNRISLMSKNNRISIANSIQIQQIKHEINLLTTLEEEENNIGSFNSSISSQGSKQQILRAFKSKKNLVELESNENSINESFQSSYKQQQHKNASKQQAGIRITISNQEYNQLSSQQESKECNQQSNKYHLAPPLLQKNYKKISIMCMSDFQLNNSSELFSVNSVRSLEHIKIPCIALSQALIQTIFDTPMPFLINLSMCLMLKYLCFSKTALNQDNVAWIVSVSTIVGYKIYYDEEFQGLIQCFANILGVESAIVIDLERHFLKQIQYEAVISNKQYHEVLYRIISCGQE